jgi:ankyrin repeat protein
MSEFTSEEHRGQRRPPRLFLISLGGPRRPLPATTILLNFEQQRKRAKDLLHAHRAGGIESAVRIARCLPKARGLAVEQVLSRPFTLSEAQFVIAREAGFASWPALKRHIDRSGIEGLLDAVLAGEVIEEIDSSLVRSSISLAAAMADEDAVSALLQTDASLADRPGGRRGWRPLMYLCASRHQRDEPDVSARRAAIARRLLAAGAAVTGREAGFQSTHGTMLEPDNELVAIEAAASGCASSELIQVLRDAGANLSRTVVTMLEAVRGGKHEVVRLLLAALPEDVLWQVGWALSESVSQDRVDLTRLLATRATLPAERQLVEAVQLGRNVETLRTLLGDPPQGEEDDPSNQYERVRRKVYQAAVRCGHDAAAELLSQPPLDETAITAADRVIGACAKGDAEGVRKLLAVHSPIAYSIADHRMLVWAARNGTTSTVRLMLEAGLDPNTTDIDGEGALHAALHGRDSYTIVDFLLTAGASADLRNFDSRTALDLALQLPDRETRTRITKRLLDAGARPENMGGTAADTDRDTLFERAADAIAAGDQETLRVILDAAPDLVHARSPRPHRATLLHYCGANGVEEFRQKTPANIVAITKLLLDRGADPNATCKLYGSGPTTLGLALTSVHPLKAGVRTQLAEVLLRGGAIFRDPAPAGSSGLGFAEAAALGQLEVVRTRLEHDVPPPDASRLQNAFWVACEFGRTNVVEFLLHRFPDLQSKQNGSGQTGLHEAAQGGHAETVQVLMRQNPPVDVKNVWDATPLSSVLWSAINGDPHIDYAPVVEALVDGGAPVGEGYADWWDKQEGILYQASKPRISAALRRANPAA